MSRNAFPALEREYTEQLAEQEEQRAMYAVKQSNGQIIFTGTQAECWQHMDDEGLPQSFYVCAM